MTEVRRLGVVVAAAALLVVLLVLVRLSFGALVSLPRVDQLQRGLVALENGNQAMLDQDTALRGFLSTSDRRFLDQFSNAQPVLTVSNFEVQRLLDEPELRSRVLDMLLTQQRWQNQWAAVARNGQPPGDSTSFLLLGKSLFDDYREGHARLRNDLLVSLNAAQHADTVMQWSIGGAVLLIAVVALVLALVGSRRLRRNVVAPVTALLASMRDIQDGRLVPPAPIEGSAELAALGAGLGDMTVALRREREEGVAHASRLEAQSDRLRTILVMGREIGGSLNTRYVVETTVQAVCRLAGGPVLLWTTDEKNTGLELAHDSRTGPVMPDESQHVDLGVGLLGRAARYGQISRAEPDAEDGSGVAIPLVVGARVIGVLQCMDSDGRPPDEAAVSAVELLATLAGAAIEASRLHAATERLSQFDPLTSLANRRRLTADLASAVAGAKRHGHPMALVMLDIDHFKQLNDRYGHQRGDVVLQEVAAVLRAEMRDGETAYRYGGEEFAILVSIGDTPQAGKLSERLRARVEREFRRGGKQLLTVSFGVAGLPDDAMDGESLVALADRALYAAKNAGRNRVAMAADLAPEPHDLVP